MSYTVDHVEGGMPQVEVKGRENKVSSIFVLSLAMLLPRLLWHSVWMSQFWCVDTFPEIGGFLMLHRFSVLRSRGLNSRVKKYSSASSPVKRKPCYPSVRPLPKCWKCIFGYFHLKASGMKILGRFRQPQQWKESSELKMKYQQWQTPGTCACILLTYCLWPQKPALISQ